METLNDKITEYILNSELVQCAIIEAVHRFYFDECFTKGDGARPKNDELTKEVNILLQNLHCQRPDWRYRLKKIPERYTVWEPTNALHISCKPKHIINPSLKLEVVYEKL